MKIEKIISELKNGKKFVMRNFGETKYFSYYLYNFDTNLIEEYSIGKNTNGKLSYYPTVYSLWDTFTPEEFYALFKGIKYKYDIHWKDRIMIVDRNYPTDFIKKWEKPAEIWTIDMQKRFPNISGYDFDEYVKLHLDGKYYTDEEAQEYFNTK